jgi:hypothetical protein
MIEDIEVSSKPGYFNQKPLLTVFSSMKRVIGVQDSCIQTNEVAIRYLEEQSNITENSEEFIRNLCKKYRISRGTYDFKHFRKIQYKSYILQSYNLVEPFFKKLNKQYRYYNNFTGIWKTKEGDKNLDPFNQLLQNLPSDIATAIKNYPEYHLLNYYRLVRNSIVHLQEDEEEHSKTTKYYEDHISNKVNFFYENYDLSAPNKPDSISYSDFMLYTRALKYFSNILSDYCFPSIDCLVSVAKADKLLQDKLLGTRRLNFSGALEKRINTLRGYFAGEFGINNQDFFHKELKSAFCRAYLDDEGTDYSGHLKKRVPKKPKL